MFKRKTRRSREFKKNDRVIDLEEARENRRQKREKLAKTSRHYKRSLITKEEAKEKIKLTSERSKIKNRRRRVIYLVIIGIIVAIIGISALNIIALINERNQLQEQQLQLQKEKDKLENQLKNSNTDEFVEQQARSQLRLIKPGETLYVLPEETTGGAVDNEQIKE